MIDSLSMVKVSNLTIDGVDFNAKDGSDKSFVRS